MATVNEPGERHLRPLVLSTIAFTTSAAILVLEIVAARLLAPYVGVTLQTYSAIIGVILAGIAAGAWLGGRLADRTAPTRIVGPVLILGGFAALAEIPLIRLLGPRVHSTAPTSVIGLTIAVFFVPAVVLSTISPLLTKAKLTELASTGRTVGGLSAISTTGALVGTFLTGFVLVPHLRSRVIVALVGTMLIMLGIALTVSLRSHRSSRLITTVIVAVAVAATISAGTTEARSSWGDPCQMESSYFCARVEPSPSDPSKRLLLLDEEMHSSVDVDDPTYLEFEYIRAFRIAIDAWRPPPAPLRALHIGGGGFTMPRYLEATRPGSDSLVFEIDSKLVALDEQRLGLHRSPHLRSQSGDGRQGLRRRPSDSADLVIGDAFGGLSVPWHLATREVALEVQRVVTNRGLYVLNVIDSPPQKFIKAEIVTVQSVFAHVAVIGFPEAFAGTTGANFVVVASDEPLPIDAMTAALDAERESLRMELRNGPALDRFTANGVLLTDEFGPVDQLYTR
jgi:spermidine synthase